jgi:hypothetical protein
MKQGICMVGSLPAEREVMTFKLWPATGAALFAAAAIVGFAPAAQAQAVPSGCTLRSLDGNRSSEARCAPGSHLHTVICKYGDNLAVYRRVFTTYSMIVCPNAYRISFHDIQRK